MSKIAVQCSGCGRRYAAPASRAGSSLNCLTCSTPIPIPVPARQAGLGGSQFGEAQEATHYSPAQTSAPASNYGRLDPAIKIAIGVGGLALGALILAIVVHSFGGANDDLPIAQTQKDTSLVENQGPSHARPIPQSSRDSSELGHRNSATKRQPISMPVESAEKEASSEVGKAYYDKHGWVQSKGIAGSFLQWFPEKPERFVQHLSGLKVVTYQARADRLNACMMSVVNHHNDSPSNRKALFDQMLQMRMRGSASLLSKEWKQENGVEYLEAVISVQNGNSTEYTRIHVIENFLVTQSWLVVKPEEPDMNAIEMFKSGLELATQ